MYLTRRQVRQIDRAAIERYGIPGIVLMENAARQAADVAWEMLGRPGRVAIVCGGGNNGGDGLAVARHLHNRGADVTVHVLVDPHRYQGDALTNWRIVQAMHLPTRVEAVPVLGRPDLLVDAVFGTGLAAPPRPPFAQVAEAINNAGCPVLAIDLPSGLDCDSGVPLGDACVRATRTITFVAQKAGFANPHSRQYTGQVTVADIGCPRELVGDWQL